MSAGEFRRQPRQSGPQAPGETVPESPVEYLRYLSRQRAGLLWRHPEPGTLRDLTGSPRMWERRAGDDDFAEVRIAADGRRPTADIAALQPSAIEDLETLTAITVPHLPLSVRLRAFSRVTLRGEREPVCGLTRAVIGQLAVLHSPGDLRIAVVAAPDRLAAWDWVRPLPHTRSSTGPLIFDTMLDLEKALGTDLSDRPRYDPAARQPTTGTHLVVILDGGEVAPTCRLIGVGPKATTVVDLSGQAPGGAGRWLLRLNVTAATVAVDTPRQTTLLGTPDALTIAQAEELSHQLAGYEPFEPPENARAESPRVERPRVESPRVENSRVESPRAEDSRAENARAENARGERPPLETPPVEKPVVENPPLKRPTLEMPRAARTSVERTVAVGPPVEKLPVVGPPVVRPAVQKSSEPVVRAVWSLDGGPSLTELLGIADVSAIDPRSLWQSRPNRARLCVPLGVDAGGHVVELDLKDSSQGGMGPNGLIIGAAGSGKSELLRTTVAALALTHSPAEINFVLIGRRGGATFDTLEALPHTSAVLTIPADEAALSDGAALFDRAHDVLAGELARRSSHLGRRQSRGIPLPVLLIVGDEFGELFRARPDFIDLFIEIARQGPALGVHLLLAGRHLDENRLRGLDAHLSCRIALRTFSAPESRAVIGVADAHELPEAPGHGYLKANTAPLQRFQAAYVSGPHEEARQVGPAHRDGAAQRRSTLEVIVGRLAGEGPPAHQMWLPPLAEPPNLTDLLGEFPDAVENRTATLAVPIGIVDRPFEQRREPYVLELGGAAGNIAVVGGPRSGRSTLLRTLIAALALTHSPSAVQFYCLDLGGGALGTLDELPHLSGVAGRQDGDAIRRTLSEITTLLDEREVAFAERGIDSIVGYRLRRAVGDVPVDPFGDVFLVVDGWAALRQEYPELESVVTGLAARGLGYGVHVVVTASRWFELRPSFRDLFGSRIELRLGDPADSDIDRRAAQNVPPASPGRGLTRDKLHFLSAVPRIDGSNDVFDLAEGTADLVGRVKAAWPHESAPRLRLLPRLLPAGELTGPGLPIGLDEVSLAPVRFDDPANPSHLVIFGDQGCGKTNLLRLIARSVAAKFALDEARVVLVDYRRGLLGAIEGDHLLTHATTSSILADAMGSIHAAMARRLPGPEVTREQLRDRSWWRGPDLYILVDDYDLVATAGDNPLSSLIELLPYSRDIGLHLIVARRVGGAVRATYEPLLRQLEHVDSRLLVMSGSPEEGKLFGKMRPGPQPPGRGHLVRPHGGTTVVQTAWSEPV